MNAPAGIPPTMKLPTVSVYADGTWLADGRDGDTDAPQVMTDLVVRWGRSTVVDQPQPSTCSLTLEDKAGGSRFLDLVKVGGRLDVLAAAVISSPPDPGGTGVTVIDEQFTSGVGNAYRSAGSGALSASGGVLNVDSSGTGSVTVTVPPAKRQPTGGDPTAWDSVPKSAPGDTWHVSVDVKLPAPFSGWSGGWGVEVRPSTFTSPWAVPVHLDLLTDFTDLGNGWRRYTGEFLPPIGYWVGVSVRFYPATGPAWRDLDGTTWDQLAGASTVRLNQANDPAGTTSRWRSIGAGVGGVLASSYVTGAVDGPLAELTSYYRKTWTTGTTDWTPSMATGDAVYLDTGAGLFPVVAGKTYTLSCWMRHSSAKAKQYQILAYLYNASGALVRYPLTTAPAFPVNTWVRNSITFTVQPGEVGLRATLTMTSGQNHQEWAAGETLDATGLLIEESPTMGGYFDGSTPDTPYATNDWTGAAELSTSTQTLYTDPGAAWRDLGRLQVDNVQLLAPATGTLRDGMVFSGRITDLEASYDDIEEATYVEVTAADQRGELGNRDVGDEPWLEETIGARFARIVTASGQPIESRVSPTAAAFKVSWRDVDRQPAMVLLDELAVSADGVLWAATHPTTGPYLELESLLDRPALFVLYADPDGTVRIRIRDDIPTGTTEVNTCDVLLEPVRWRQDIEDTATRVSVTWREQTEDEDGNEAPTDRTEVVYALESEDAIGVHRISIGTQLSQVADARTVAGAVLARTGTFQWRVHGLHWHADTTDQLDGDALTRLMELLDGTSRNGRPLMLTGLPAWTPIPQSQQVGLFLEGGVYTSHDGAWELDLIVSAADSVGSTVAWQDLPGDMVTVRTNVATNPRAVSSGADGWLDTRGFNTAGAGTYAYLTGQTGPTDTGISTARRKQWTTSATANNGNAGFEVRATAADNLPVVAGRIYTASVWMRHASNTGKTVLMRASFWDAITGGTQVGATSSGSSVAVPPVSGSTATRTNRTPNPQDRTGGAAGWTTVRGFGGGGAGTYTHSQAVTAPSGVPTILTACRKTWTTASSSNPANAGFQVQADATNRFPVTAGEQIMVSAYMRTSSATDKNLVMRMTFWDAITGGTQVGAQVTGTSAVAVGGTTAWVRVSHTVIVPAGAVGMIVLCDTASASNPAFQVGEWLDASGLLIESASQALPYFDGSTASGAAGSYTWSGAAWNSPSWAVLATPWTQVAVTFAAPAGAVGARLFADTASVGDPPFLAGETIDATGLLLEEASAVGGYFDGATPGSSSGATTIAHAWTGTANASASTQTTTVTEDAWNWNEFDPDISWAELSGVAVSA